jgi:hypothetical protein
LGVDQNNSGHLTEYKASKKFSMDNYSNPFQKINFLADDIENILSKSIPNSSSEKLKLKQGLNPVKAPEAIRDKIKSSMKISFTKVRKEEKQSKCKCDKSKCMKKYCDCFNNAEFCNPAQCKCLNCENYKENELWDIEPLEKDLSNESNSNTPMFCNCTKSNCKKQYCECFKNKLKCNNLCRCIKCYNCENNIFDHCDHLNISIIKNVINIDSYCENISEYLSKKSRKKDKVFNVMGNSSPIRKNYISTAKTKLFTTTCGSVGVKNKKKHKCINNYTTEVRKKLEMKNYKNETIFTKKNNVNN